MVAPILTRQQLASRAIELNAKAHAAHMAGDKEARDFLRGLAHAYVMRYAAPRGLTNAQQVRHAR